MAADESKDVLLQAAAELLRDRGAGKVTVASVAEAAGCAKGLVHYHFKTKQNLWDAVAEHVAAARSATWESAFQAPSASEVVANTWMLLVDESVNGTARAWISLVGPQSPLTDRTAKNVMVGFRHTLGAALERFLDDLGVTLRVPNSEVAALLTSVVVGTGLQMLNEGASGELENAYAAAWLGMLSLES